MAEPRICSLLFLLIPLFAEAYPFEDCGSAYYLESIQIAGCNGYPCSMKIGSTTKVTTNLMIQGKSRNSADLVQKVYFVVNNIQLEVPVFPDLCGYVRDTNKASCLLSSGERVTYEATINVKNNVPPLPASLYWTMKDQDTGEQVVCYKTTVILTTY